MRAGYGESSGAIFFELLAIPLRTLRLKVFYRKERKENAAKDTKRNPRIVEMFRNSECYCSSFVSGL